MTHSTNLVPLLRLISLRDLLDLIAMLRDFREPLTSPEGLRRAIDLLLKLAESLGIDPALLARLRSIANDPRVLEILLALLRFGLSFVSEPAESKLTPPEC